MLRTCPWCLERTDRGTATCTRCGSPLQDDSGRELRPVDIRWKTVETEQWERLRLILTAGTPAFAVVALAAPAVLGLAPMAAALLAVGHLVILRLALLRGVLPLLGARRRLLTRWLARLGVLWLGLPGYGTALVPIAGAVVSAATFAGLTALVHWYALRCLHDERDRVPTPAWELVLVLGLAIVTVLLVAALVLVAALLGWSLVGLVSWLGQRF